MIAFSVRRWKLDVLAAALAIGVLPVGSAAAQDSSAPAAPPATAASEAKPYETTLAQFKQVVAEMAVLRNEWKSADAARRAEIRARWDELTTQGETLRGELLKTAEEAFVAAPNADPQVSDLLVGALFDGVRGDDYEAALRLGKTLIEHGCDDKRIYDLTGQAAFATSDFELAEKLLQQARDEKVLSEMGSQYLPQVAAAKEAWAKEQKLREAEAKADDLPRVLLKTSKGDIEIELFENEAPNAVANFISLVEAGFYNGLAFHRVLPNFMAQGGCPKGDGTGGPGYTIACECGGPNDRLHYRGSLSMAHAGRDTGGSQFFLTFLPTSHLDGKHTVFGRVIQGFDVLAKLQRRDPQDPTAPAADKIIKAEVVRKRDHAYEPKTSSDEFNQ